MSPSLLIHGAAGRMGRALLSQIAQADDLVLRAACESAAHPLLGTDVTQLVGQPPCGVSLSTLPERIDADCVVDFSLPEGTGRLLDVLSANPVPLVCGTTGLSVDHEAALSRLAQQVPVVAAPNFSTGVTVLFELVRRAAHLLGPEIEAEVTEIHHHHKKDAPSGTAARLVEILARELAVSSGGIVHGRQGLTGARPLSQIGVHALRGGDVVGEHTVHLFGKGERLELTHKAATRDAFAAGALVAARWAVTQSPGRYTMTHVLGL